MRWVRQLILQFLAWKLSVGASLIPAVFFAFDGDFAFDAMVNEAAAVVLGADAFLFAELVSPTPS